jgi:hypothetical protein
MFAYAALGASVLVSAGLPASDTSGSWWPEVAEIALFRAKLMTK